MYNTVEEIRAAFIRKGWNDISFTKTTEKDIRGREKILFVMNETGNIYDNRGKIYRYNIKPATN